MQIKQLLVLSSLIEELKIEVFLWLFRGVFFMVLLLHILEEEFFFLFLSDKRSAVDMGDRSLHLIPVNEGPQLFKLFRVPTNRLPHHSPKRILNKTYSFYICL